MLEGFVGLSVGTAEYVDLWGLTGTLISTTHMKQYYIKTANVKKFCKSHGKQVSKDFLEALERHLEKKLLQAINEHNGGKVRMDIALAGYILGNK